MLFFKMDEKMFNIRIRMHKNLFVLDWLIVTRMMHSMFKNSLVIKYSVRKSSKDRRLDWLNRYLGHLIRHIHLAKPINRLKCHRPIAFIDLFKIQRFDDFSDVDVTFMLRNMYWKSLKFLSIFTMYNDDYLK